MSPALETHAHQRGPLESRAVATCGPRPPAGNPATGWATPRHVETAPSLSGLWQGVRPTSSAPGGRPLPALADQSTVPPHCYVGPRPAPPPPPLLEPHAIGTTSDLVVEPGWVAHLTVISTVISPPAVVKKSTWQFSCPAASTQTLAGASPSMSTWPVAETPHEEPEAWAAHPLLPPLEIEDVKTTTSLCRSHNAPGPTHRDKICHEVRPAGP